MEDNQDLKQFVDMIIQQKFGDALSPEGAEEVRKDINNQISRLYGVKLVGAFDPADYDEIEKLLDENNIDKINEIAYNKRINQAELLAEALVEVKKIYLGI